MTQILTADDFHRINLSMLPKGTFAYGEQKKVERVASEMMQRFVEKFINAING